MSGRRCGMARLYQLEAAIPGIIEKLQKRASRHDGLA
jgi:hypothetical protein